MKMRLFSTLVSILVLSTAINVADSYTIPIPPGSRLIANHLDNGGNTLDEVLPGVPDGTQISKYNCNNTYTDYTVNGGVWLPSGGTLGPGEGAFIFNNSGAPFNLTFTGTPHVPVLPPHLPCGCGVDNLLSRQTTNNPSTFQDIMGFPPVNNTRLQQWNGSTFVTHLFVGGNWQGGVPIMNLGESVLIRIPACPTAPNIACAANKTLECGATGWTFDPPTAVGGCSTANVTITILNTITNGLCPQDITRTWQATDVCGNTSTCSQTVTLANTNPATIASVNSIINNANTIGIFFDPPVTLPSAINPANYTVYTKDGAVSVVNVGIQTNGQFVALNLGTPIGEFFSVSASNVVDVASNVVNTTAIGYISDYGSTDVGNVDDPNPAGVVYTAQGDTFEVTTGGSDIGGTSDFFHFIYQEVIGDFDMAVLVTRLDLADPLSKAGLMARETLAPDSASLQTYFTPVLGVNQIQNTVRTVAGTDTFDFSIGAPVPADPLRWLRLTRTNNTFTSYHGTDAVNWTVGGITEQPFNSTLYIGMAVASHAPNGVATTAAFTDFGKVGARPGDGVLPALNASLSSSNITLNWLRTPRDFTVQVSPNLTDWALMLAPILQGAPNKEERSMQLPLNLSSNQLFLRLVKVDRVIPDPPLTLSTGLILSLGNGNVINGSDSTLCTYTVTNAIAQTNMNVAPGNTITFATAGDSGNTLNTVLKVRKGTALSPPCDDDSAGNFKSKQTFTASGTSTNFTLVAAVKKTTPTTDLLKIKVTITITPQ